MNLYFVKSEQLTEVVWEDWFNYVGHEEPYCIAELVLASRPSQAKYLAWRTDDSFSYDFRDMPKMYYRTLALLARGVSVGKPRIVSDEPEFQHYWSMT